jgi:hypothetical protein
MTQRPLRETLLRKDRNKFVLDIAKKLMTQRPLRETLLRR